MTSGLVSEKKCVIPAWETALNSLQRVDRDAVLRSVLQVGQLDLVWPYDLAEAVPAVLLGGGEGPAVTPDNAGDRRPRLRAVRGSKYGIAGDDPVMLIGDRHRHRHRDGGIVRESHALFISCHGCSPVAGEIGDGRGARMHGGGCRPRVAPGAEPPVFVHLHHVAQFGFDRPVVCGVDVIEPDEP